MDTASRSRQIRAIAGTALAILMLGWVPVSAAAVSPLPAVAGARPGASSTAMPVWAWPLSPAPRVVRPFDKPPGPYAAGHRGLDLAGSVGQPVLAVDAGTVHHAGQVAGRGTITIEHPGGLRSTYEPLVLDPLLRVGSAVRTGQQLGSLDTSGSHCAPLACLHLGALRQGSSSQWDYVQPLFYLADVEVVLLPSPS